MTAVDLWRQLSSDAGQRMRGETRDVSAREYRDPTAATTLTRYQAPGTPMIPAWDAETAIRNAYLADVVVARCTQIIAETFSAVKFRVGADPDKPGDFDVNAPLARKLGPGSGKNPGGPCPGVSARTFWKWLVAQRILCGRHGTEIEAKGDEIVALWPLSAAWLKAIPTVKGSAWWEGFTYGSANKPKELRPEQVFYGWDPAPNDFREPYSVLQSGRLAVSVAVMTSRYNYGFLRNNAMPAAAVVTEMFANDDEYRAFKASWNGEYGGPDNAGKLRFMEVDTARSQLKPAEALNVFPLGISQRDARIIDMHKEAAMEIAIAMGVPWSKLDASGRTFSNASEEDNTWRESRIMPLFAEFADEVNAQLAPRFSNSNVGWFDTREFLPKTRQFQAVGIPALLQAKLLKINEGREWMDLEPVPDGDRFLTDDEIAQTKGAMPAQLAAVLGELRAAPIDVEHRELPPPLPALPAPETRETDDEARERRGAEWRRVDATVRTIEARWERAMIALFNRQAKITLERLQGGRGRRVREQRADVGDLFDPDFWTAETATVTVGLYEDVTASGFARIAAKFGVDFDLEAPYARDFIDARANQLAGQVTDTTYQAIKDALSAGVAEGEAIPGLAARVQHVFDVATDARATTIARTETISAYNGSSSLAMAQLPSDVVAGQEWISTPGPRTRDEHAAADGQIVAIGEAFDVGGELLAYPGDPNGSPENTVNCRCSIAGVTPDDMPERMRPAQRIPIDHARTFLSLVKEPISA